MNLLITGAWAAARERIPALEAMGHTVRFTQWETEDLPCEYDWVEGVICSHLFQRHPIESFPNLKYIQLTTAGMDHLPLDYIQANNIELHNAKGVYSIPMAEFALNGVLQLYKQGRALNENQKNHVWEKIRDLRELSGKTVLILGCGEVGRECAKRFSAFGCKVLGVNRSERELPGFETIRPLTALPELLPETDILVISIAMSKETSHILDARAFQKIKSGAVLVNIARGQLVDEAALSTWLQSHPNSGAVLDVFEEEPLPADSPLWDMSNVILTPHNSFAGEGNAARLWSVIEANLKTATA